MTGLHDFSQLGGMLCFCLICRVYLPISSRVISAQVAPSFAYDIDLRHMMYWTLYMTLMPKLLAEFHKWCINCSHWTFRPRYSPSGILKRIGHGFTLFCAHDVLIRGNAARLFTCWLSSNLSCFKCGLRMKNSAPGSQHVLSRLIFCIKCDYVHLGNSHHRWQLFLF